jgi:hypothetical protein
MQEPLLNKILRQGLDKIIRRLDILIEAAKMPPCLDVEGTKAPRRPLSQGCIAAMAAAETREEKPQNKKRGRPRKQPIVDDYDTEVFFFVFVLIYNGFL